MLVLNPKLLYSIRKNANRIARGQFAETEVKEFLIDLRSMGRVLQKPLSDHPLYKREYDYLIDICDSIAHPHRNQGEFSNYIRETSALIDRKLSQLIILDDNPHPETPTMDFALPSDAQVIDPDGLVFYLATIVQACFRLARYNYELDFQAFMNQRDDIILCIFSLLHCVTIDIDLDKKNRPVQGGARAVLRIYCFDKKYGLYCDVINSETERKAKQRVKEKGGPAKPGGRVVVRFTVMKGRKTNMDNLEFPKTVVLPEPVETYRDETGRLRLRYCTGPPLAK